MIYFEVMDKDKEVEVAMQYTDRYNEMLLSYANNINTTEGGFHMVGFKTALTRVFNDYAKRNKFLKGDDSLSGEDIREGLTAIVSVKLTEPQFEGQTKTKLGNSEMRGFVESATSENVLGIPGGKSDAGQDHFRQVHACGKSQRSSQESQRTDEKKERFRWCFHAW